jgi:class 3 adenylate cyclase
LNRKIAVAASSSSIASASSSRSNHPIAAKATNELTFKPDQSSGAGQLCALANAMKESVWLVSKIEHWSLRWVVVLIGSMIALSGGIWLMNRFLIAEGAITLAAFPLTLAIVGTFYIGPIVAFAWGATVFGAFVWLFGITPVWAGAYALLYGATALAAVIALRFLGFSDLLKAPVRSLFGWYLVVGFVAPVTITLFGVPLLVAGGGADPDADLLLLFISNFVSDSFSPISLGIGLCAFIATLASSREVDQRMDAGSVAEKVIWLALILIASIAIVVFGDSWARNGISDMTPAYYLLLAWSALRFSLLFAMIATAAVGLLVTSCATFGLGGTAIPSSTQDALSVYANLLALTVLAQISSAMTLQRRLDYNRAIAAELDRAHLKRYFSPRIVDDLLLQSDAVDRTRSQRVVVMFADIVGFTSIAETQTPEETITLLREFDTVMEGQIFDNDGVVDKFMGDGVMATFGLPLVGKNDVTSAVRCALGMMSAASQLAMQRQSKGHRPYGISIGLHYGEVVVGNVGSDRNLSFTVIGDAVNTASRLESLSRELSAVIVASDEVIESVKHELEQMEPEILACFQRVGETSVKGRHEPVEVWILPLNDEKSS